MSPRRATLAGPIAFACLALAVLALAGCRSARQDRPAGATRAGSHAHGPGSALPGTLVPDLTLRDSTGRPWRLGDLRAGASGPRSIAVLTFWCTTCSSCRLVEKDFDAMARERASEGVECFMVDSNVHDDAERVNTFLAQRGLGFRVLMDEGSALARTWGTTRTTTSAVIDAEGRVRYYGGYPGAEAAVRNLLAGDPVAVPTAPGGG